MNKHGPIVNSVVTKRSARMLNRNGVFMWRSCESGFNRIGSVSESGVPLLDLCLPLNLPQTFWPALVDLRDKLDQVKERLAVFAQTCEAVGHR